MRYYLSNAVFLQRMLFTLQSYHQIVVMMRMEHNQLISTGAHTDGSNLRLKETSYHHDLELPIPSNFKLTSLIATVRFMLRNLFRGPSSL